MGLDVDDLVAKFRSQTGADEDDLPNEDILSFLNRSWWEVCDKFNFREKESSFNITTVADTVSYNLEANTEAVQALHIVDDNTPADKRQLLRLMPHVYNQLYNTNNTGQPTHYLREASTIKLHPIPDDEYTIKVTKWTELSDLVEGGTVTIPRSWHEIILYGGLQRYYIDAKDWTNAMMMSREYTNKINTAIPVESKEERDSHQSGLKVRQTRGRKW